MKNKPDIKREEVSRKIDKYWVPIIARTIELLDCFGSAAESLTLLETLQASAPVGFGYVDLDFPDAIRRSVVHLADLGHRKIALFNFSAAELEAGYCSAVRGLAESTRAGIVAEGLRVEQANLDDAFIALTGAAS